MGQNERRSDALSNTTVLKERYMVRDVLGNGGFGITYSAWDKEKNCKVAMKELYPRKDVYRESDEITVKIVPGQEEYFSELAKKFEDEARLLMQLNGENNIIKVYDLFYANNTIYYSMEYLDGCDLKTYINKHGPMSWEQLGPMMYQILQALGTLHKQNLIHRDISPDNLFLTKDDQLHLIDFGSVRTYQGNQSFTVFVKQHFAPWEQYETNGKQGPWTDIYSLSVSMYMLLSGKLPPKAPDRKMGKKVVSLKTYCPKMPSRVARAIEKGMNFDARERFQSAAEYIQELYGDLNVPPRNESGKQLSKYWIYGCSGLYAGKRLRLYVNQIITFGRQSSNNVVFPDTTIGVSRNQCALFVNASDILFIRDTGSTYGTFLNNVRIDGNWTQVPQGSNVRFGNEFFLVK